MKPQPLPPLLFLCAIVAMVALQLLAPMGQIVHGPWRLLGMPLIAIGLALNAWADRLFKRRGTAVSPLAASTALVIDGPFAYTRNPMYLGLVLLSMGIALALGGVSPWLIVPVFAGLLRVRFISMEESKLAASFGQQYLEYAARVRRWL